MLNRLKTKIQAGGVTFGLRESIILALVGIAIGIVAAVHYAR